MRSMKIFLLSFLILVFAVEATAQSELGTKVQAILGDSILKTAQIGVSIRNNQTNKIVFEQNGNKSFTPASNLKLVTTAAALTLLGPEYRFITKVNHSGSITAAGELTGILLLKGSGDPTLGANKMASVANYQTLIQNWVAVLKSKGIKEFKGTFIIDATHFEYNAVPNDYTWGDIGNYYGAGSFGFNINENQYNITLKPGEKIGDPVSVVSIVPKDTSWKYSNTIYTGAAGSGDQTIFYSSPYNSQIYAQGSIPIGKSSTVKGSIPDPSDLFAQLFMEEMKLQGIKWSGDYKMLKPGETIVSNGQWNTLIEYQSPTLKEIATYTNLISNNLYAECMLKEIGFKTRGVGSVAAGTNEVKKYLSRQGIDTTGLILKDGSGMSPFNSISPNQLTLLLSKQSSNLNLMSCIPVAGKDGTVSHICKETGGKVRVKSGTMSGTVCYSGYVQSLSGTQYAVSLLVNKHDAKTWNVQKVLEKVLQQIYQQ